MKFILLFIFIIIFIYFKSNHLHIKFLTFFKKGFLPIRNDFGVVCYCGKQGNGKTYSVIEYLRENKDKPIFANIKSIKGIDYTYFNGLNELLDLRSQTDCIIVYDEIFTLLDKKSRITSEVLDFLSQMRKRRIIFITTAQEWLEINMTLRRYCRYQVECKMNRFFGLGILIKRFYDAERMQWSNDDNEYIAPLLETTISKCNLCVANSYDTFETINSYK